MSSETHIINRGAIVSGVRAGRTAKEISEFNNIPISTVNKFKKHYTDFIDEGNSPEDYDITRKPHKRRSDAHGNEMVARVQELVDTDPSQSMRSMARELDVSATLVRKIVKEDLRYKSYGLRKGQFMSEATKLRRLEKAKKLLNRLKKPPTPNILIFFSDEKNFQQDQVVNSRNNRWLCDDPEEVPIVMKTKFPATVMVLGVVSNEGDVMPPHVFPHGLRVNTEAYLDVMVTVVKPWMDGVAAGRPYIWQQDGAPAHNSNRTQEWCSAHLPHFWEKEVWPPSSPDCNPLDYYVWGVTERDVNKAPHNTKESLIAKIMEVFNDLSREEVARACNRFRGRLEKVIRANGDFIE